jgi:hypothetical protein
MKVFFISTKLLCDLRVDTMSTWVFSAWHSILHTVGAKLLYIALKKLNKQTVTAAQGDSVAS